MKVASPKTSTKNPINLDMILVCKKQKSSSIIMSTDGFTKSHIDTLKKAGITCSNSDSFNIKASHAIIIASRDNLTCSDYRSLISTAYALGETSIPDSLPEPK